MDFFFLSILEKHFKRRKQQGLPRSFSLPPWSTWLEQIDRVIPLLSLDGGQQGRITEESSTSRGWCNRVLTFSSHLLLNLGPEFWPVLGDFHVNCLRSRPPPGRFIRTTITWIVSREANVCPTNFTPTGRKWPPNISCSLFDTPLGGRENDFSGPLVRLVHEATVFKTIFPTKKRFATVWRKKLEVLRFAKS